MALRRTGPVSFVSLEYMLGQPTESTTQALRVSLLLSAETFAPSGGKFYIKRETNSFGESISPRVFSFALGNLFLSFLRYATFMKGKPKGIRALIMAYQPGGHRVKGLYEVP